MTQSNDLPQRVEQLETGQIDLKLAVSSQIENRRILDILQNEDDQHGD